MVAEFYFSTDDRGLSLFFFLGGGGAGGETLGKPLPSDLERKPCELQDVLFSSSRTRLCFCFFWLLPHSRPVAWVGLKTGKPSAKQSSQDGFPLQASLWHCLCNSLGSGFPRTAKKINKKRNVASLTKPPKETKQRWHGMRILCDDRTWLLGNYEVQSLKLDVPLSHGCLSQVEQHGQNFLFGLGSRYSLRNHYKGEGS